MQSIGIYRYVLITCVIQYYYVECSGLWVVNMKCCCWLLSFPEYTSNNTSNLIYLDFICYIIYALLSNLKWGVANGPQFSEMLSETRQWTQFFTLTAQPVDNSTIILKVNLAWLWNNLLWRHGLNTTSACTSEHIICSSIYQIQIIWLCSISRLYI